MKNHSKKQQHLAHLQGSVERITFHNQENGFCVLRIKVKSQHDLITVIGHTAAITPGEYINVSGVWVHDKKHGLQLKAEQLKVVPPTSIEGIQKYLGSGMVKGIGSHFAKKLVAQFGEAIFDVIENSPERLTDIEGIGKKRKAQLLASWAKQKSIRDIMVFLQTHGLGTARAVRIYKTYGDQAITQVCENPYRLALDIHGIGFKTADTLAEHLGIAKDSILRAQAGIHHVLQELCQHGHCAAEYKQLVQASMTLLDIAEPIIVLAIDQEKQAKTLVFEEVGGHFYIFPAMLYQAEVSATKHLLRLYRGNPPWGILDIEKAIAWVEKKTNLQLSYSQKQAITTVFKHKLSIITGGPGVGKTTIVNSILKILQAKQLAVCLCAPTGRAAKRLTETTGSVAKTIHRLLEFDAKHFSFKHHQNNPLVLDVLIIDESSMIDIILLLQLLKAIPDHAAVIFVGDVDQLPSVGPGAVLLDMIHSHTIPVVRLTDIFRQAQHSHIIVNAHRINQGQMPIPSHSKTSDFYTIYTETPEATYEQLIQLVAQRIPQYLRCRPLTDIQVLTPMNRGGLGSHALNIALQQKLNGSAEPKITHYGLTLAPGDKVIQIINNYDKEVFNGDIGFIARINLEEQTVDISFDSRIIDYQFNELDEIRLAYAISIHKSQGSEFPVVVIPLSMQHYTLLARNLLYTGVTRGKQLVVLIGQKKAIAIAVHNNQENQRLTRLSQRLHQAYHHDPKDITKK